MRVADPPHPQKIAVTFEEYCTPVEQQAFWTEDATVQVLKRRVLLIFDGEGKWKWLLVILTSTTSVRRYPSRATHSSHSYSAIGVAQHVALWS